MKPISEKAKGNLLVLAWIVAILAAIPIVWINFALFVHYFKMQR